MSESVMLPAVAILCGGMATRLKPISDTVPKALVNVGGKPFICYQLDQIRRQGVTDVVLCVGHKGEMIEDVVQDGRKFDLNVQYAYDGDTVLGTGGALRNAAHLLGSEFFVLYGDAYLRVDYNAAYRRFVDSGKQGLMAVFENGGKWDSSNVLFENEEILAYSKTQKTVDMRHIDYGLGILQTAALQAYSPNQQFDLALVYEQLVSKRQLAAFEVSARFYEIGSHHGLKEFRDWIASQASRAQ